MKWLQRPLLMILLCLEGLDAFAANLDPIVLKDDHAVRTIAPHTSWYYDTSGKETIADVLAKPLDVFQSNATTPIPYTYAFEPFWVRFSLQNDSSETRWYLVARMAVMEHVEVYEIRADGSWQRWPTLSDRRTPTARLVLAQGETKHYVVKYQSYDPPSELFAVLNGEDLREADAKELPFYGILVGIFFAVILYNAFIYASLRRRIHLYYLFFATANAFLAMYSVNVPLGVVDLVSGVVWCHTLRFLAPLTTILFAKALLETKKNCPRLDMSLTALLGFYALLIVHRLVTGNQELLSMVVDLIMFLTVILLLVAGVFSWRKGNTSAKYFLTAMGVFFAGVIILVFYPLLGLDPNLYTTSALLVGQAGEMILMSLALASLIKSLEEGKVRAEATALVKSKLLRVMSHDIVNPLSLIKGFTQVMQRRPDETEHLAKIARSSAIIENIVNFIVKYESRRGAQPLQVSPVPLRDVFDDLAFLFQQAFAEKGIQATFEVQPKNLAVLAEKISLSNEILANLISNAIKFSFVGGRVDIKAVAKGEQVIITVQDHGIGIPEETLTHIFDSAKNHSRQGTGGELGSGFGMPIVWSFVQESGGQIDISSVTFDQDTQDSGTTVTIILKRATVV